MLTKLQILLNKLQILLMILGYGSEVQVLGYSEEYHFHLFFFNLPTHSFVLIRGVMAVNRLFLFFPNFPE